MYISIVLLTVLKIQFVCSLKLILIIFEFIQHLSSNVLKAGVPARVHPNV